MTMGSGGLLPVERGWRLALSFYGRRLSILITLFSTLVGIPILFAFSHQYGATAATVAALICVFPQIVVHLVRHRLSDTDKKIAAQAAIQQLWQANRDARGEHVELMRLLAITAEGDVRSRALRRSLHRDLDLRVQMMRSDILEVLGSTNPPSRYHLALADALYCRAAAGAMASRAALEASDRIRHDRTSQAFPWAVDDSLKLVRARCASIILRADILRMSLPIFSFGDIENMVKAAHFR